MRAAISIDLGAAFTKVAIRQDPNENSTFLQHERFRLDESHICIPSIVAWRENDDKWVFGMDAVDIQGNEEIHVFRNWKPLLFTPPEEVLEPNSPIGKLFYESLPMGGEGWGPARIIAVKFLSWIRETILSSFDGDLDLDTSLVRVSIPEFALETEHGEEMERVLIDAGWFTPSASTVSEPLTNVAGALSQGRNRIITNEDCEEEPDMEFIFAGSELAKFNELNAADDRQDSFYLLLVDVGAYTSDFSLVELNPELPWHFSVCETHSEPYGIEMLDNLVQRGLPMEKSDLIVNLTPAERELFRRTVYGEARPWALNNLTIAEGDEARMVDKCIAGLSARIGHEIDRFLESLGAETIDEAIFTGGGTNISRLVQPVAAALTKKGVRTFHFAESVTLPHACRQIRLNQQLIRGSSAIGGASVLFDDF